MDLLGSLLKGVQKTQKVAQGSASAMESKKLSAPRPTPHQRPPTLASGRESVERLRKEDEARRKRELEGGGDRDKDEAKRSRLNPNDYWSLLGRSNAQPAKQALEAFERLERDRKEKRRREGMDAGDEPLVTTADECRKACGEIRVHKEIAVDLEGVNFGRDGRISLVQIATADKVYLFDIYVGRAELFDAGLREILEDTRMLKVLHDCRTDSDALFHCNSVKLQNVFDTQVGYAVWQRQCGHNTPLPIGLNTLLKNYTQGRNEAKDEAKQGMMDDELYWERRPMTTTMMKYAREDVLYLLKAFRSITALLSRQNYHRTIARSATYAGMFRDQPKGWVRERTEFPTYGFAEWDIDAQNAVKLRNLRHPNDRFSRNKRGPSKTEGADAKKPGAEPAENAASGVGGVTSDPGARVPSGANEGGCPDPTAPVTAADAAPDPRDGAE